MSFSAGLQSKILPIIIDQLKLLQSEKVVKCCISSKKGKWSNFLNDTKTLSLSWTKNGFSAISKIHPFRLFSSSSKRERRKAALPEAKLCFFIFLLINQAQALLFASLLFNIQMFSSTENKKNFVVGGVEKREREMPFARIRLMIERNWSPLLLLGLGLECDLMLWIKVAKCSRKQPKSWRFGPFPKFY